MKYPKEYLDEIKVKAKSIPSCWKDSPIKKKEKRIYRTFTF